ncbi:MAG: hypothetical protein KY468_09995 [Armatimonadetes bacterium]|nr:hypothetical protein [Armatimonadota bacterium]
MSDLQAELASLRRDLEDLRAKVEGRPVPPPPPPHNPMDDFSENLRADLNKKGRNAGIGSMRMALLLQMKGFTRAGTTSSTWTSLEDMPTEEQVRKNLEAYAKDPLTIRALYGFLRPFFEGKPLTLTGAELAESLGTDEGKVAAALQALIESDVIKEKRTAEGQAMYQLEFADPFIGLLLT